jgi:hypothetical protein
VGDSKQSDQRLSSDSPRHPCGSEDLGQEHRPFERQDTRSKTIPVARDYVKVHLELINLHKEVFLTTYKLFVNKNPFFLELSRKIKFTAINHIAYRTVQQILMNFI